MDQPQKPKSLNLDLLIKLLKLTTSSVDAEALLAMRKANEQLGKFGGDWEALLLAKVTILADPFDNLVEPPPTAGRSNGHDTPPFASPTYKAPRGPKVPPRPSPPPSPRASPMPGPNCVCANCGLRFYSARSRLYCGDACEVAAGQHMKKCVHCGFGFQAAKGVGIGQAYCSRACNDYANPPYQMPKDRSVRQKPTLDNL